MHPFEKFHQNFFKFYSMKDFKFLTHELKQGKLQSGACCSAKHRMSQTLPCGESGVIAYFQKFVLRAKI